MNSQNLIVGYVTKNTAKSPRVDPDLLVFGLTALNNWTFYSSLFYRELYAHNGTFLGVTSPDKTASLSIINESGSYGSSFSSTSIFNRFGTYGSEFSGQSSYNSFASTPPALFTPRELGGQLAAYVTKNSFRTPSADPDVLRAALFLAPDMPWIIASSYSLEGFATMVGAASRAQTVSISASNLVSSVKVSLLPLEKHWEISANGSSFGSEFHLQPVNGRVNANVYLRLSASAPSTANEPGGRNLSGFTVTTAYAGASIYMTGSVSNAAPTKIQQTISFTQPSSQTFAPNRTFALVATATSGQPVTFTSSNPNVVSVSGNIATIKAAGSATITASQGGNATYQPAQNVTRTVTVAKANQSIRPFAATKNVRFGTVLAFTNTNSTAGLPVKFERVSGPVTVSGNRARVTGVGNVVVRAVQAGNANYSAATRLTNSFTTVKANQTITFTNLPARVSFRANRSIPLRARSSSGLPVTYVSGNPKILQIVGTKALMKRRGTTTVTAVRPGNANYNAARSVKRTIVIR